MKLPRMLRFRGKRAWYLVFAAFATFLIFSWSHQEDSQTSGFEFPPPPKKAHEDVFTPPARTPVKIATPAPVVEQTRRVTSTPAAKQEPVIPAKTKEVEPPIDVADEPTPTPDKQSVPGVVLPDRKKPSVVDDVYGTDGDEVLHPVDYPGRQEVPIVSATKTIHWTKQTEHFPLPSESIIQLPTGAPVKIPKIQHSFNDETTDAKISREKRQVKVKAEFQKAWKGYRDKAWLHDELSPVSGNYRDPFCGWAATLVDALDTLWIMGLKDEFDEAARAVDLIDFTTSPRSDIPMFETTIRYLGGLLAAYDVSGGRYKNLLDKAVELADILLGAFDTPNRMPILYYRWMPDFASQPHRASTYSNTAELGSLSMEFTRLAQLTKDPRYYDAVARVTNALSEFQDRRTKLEGVFPNNIDASGCNRTATSLEETFSIGKTPEWSEETYKAPAVGYQPEEELRFVDTPKLKKQQQKSGSGLVGMNVLPGESNQPAKAQIVERDENRTDIKNSQNRKRALTEDRKLWNRTTVQTPVTDPDTGLPLDVPAAKAKVAATLGDWDCVKQGLDSSSPYGVDKFSMAGGQDSTYEYFPKQYLLLGGLEGKYRKLYLKTIEAVRKHMLYRPMIPGDRQILFSGGVSRSAGERHELTLEPEVEHLTCFIGGMVGMGAKIFGIEGDLEIAKKLTDGCVWAYESFDSGIMPEGSLVVPCQSMESCPWNETIWKQAMDPMGDSRDESVRKYIASKAEREAEEKTVQLEDARLAALAEEKPVSSTAEQERLIDSSPRGVNGSERDTQPKAVSEDPKVIDLVKSGIEPGKPKEYVQAKSNTAPTDSDSTKNAPPPDIGGEPGKPKVYHQATKPVETPFGSDALKKVSPASLQKRAVIPVEEKPSVRSQPRPGDAKSIKEAENPTPTIEDSTILDADKSARKAKGTEAPNPLHDIAPHEREYDDFVRVNEVASGREAEMPLTDKKPEPVELVDPMMPLTHKQWVNMRIEEERVPPGFTMIKSAKYILRPEAIESVWYMYRITGDPVWQEKGWKMFEAILKATSSAHGHSALYDVTIKEPVQVDEMESFWLAETLKYFYLLYSTPDVISLDEWVLNTEAHPFKRPV